MAPPDDSTNDPMDDDSADDDSSDSDDTTDIPTPDFPIMVAAEPPALASTSKSAFVVTVSTDRSSGTTGTVFNLTADVSGSGAAISTYAWSVDEDDSFAADASTMISFDQPGDYLVNVTVENADGQSATDGILLTVFDPSTPTQSVTSAITPTSGTPGTFVRIQSDSLNDPAGLAEVMVDGIGPVEVFRPEPGVANFIIPPDAADGLFTATDVSITLLIDSLAAETFSFSLSPLPALAGAPGEVTREWLESGEALLADTQTDLFGAMAGLDAGLTAEEIAFLQALLHYASVQFGQVSEVLLPLMDELDSETLTLIDQGLIANGVDPDAAKRLILTVKQRRTAKNAKDVVIDELCTFHEVLDDVLRFIDAVSKGALATPLLQLPLAGTPLGPPLLAFANIAVDLGIVGDLLRELKRHVPRVDESLTVRADPTFLTSESEKAVITVEATLITQSDICNNAPADILAAMIAQATERILLNVPLARMAYLIKNRTFYLRDPGIGTSIQSIQQFDNYLTQTINTIAKGALEASAVGLVFSQVRTKVCALDDRRTLRLQPDPSILTRSPPNAGTLLNLQDETIDFYCTLNDQGKVTITARRECGIKGNVPTGQVEITCFGEECTEDASQYLDVEILLDQVQTRDNVCKNVSETLETRIAAITLINTHPTRTIRVAGVMITESDKRDLPRGPCEDPGNFPSVDACVEGLVGGCSLFASFLQPGQRSFTAKYNCKQERLYPGSGACGEMELETETSFWFFHAVFCDDEETAQENFCPNVHDRMLRFGFDSSNLWPVVRDETCP